MAIAGLGGLGAEQGPPELYTVAFPNLLPPLLPWLLVLGLLAFKANRCAHAWWIFVPLGIVAGVGASLQPVLEFLSSTEFGMVADVVACVAFGIAAGWLLSPYLRRSHRFLTFLLSLLVIVGFSLLVLLLQQGMGTENDETGAEALAVLAVTFALALSLCLAGLCCRRRYCAVRLMLWLFTLLAAFWLLLLTPFFAFAAVGGGGPSVPQFCGVVALAIAVTFVSVLPFLVLSFANSFYRDRLRRFLHLDVQAAPPVIAPPAPVIAAATK